MDNGLWTEKPTVGSMLVAIFSWQCKFSMSAASYTSSHVSVMVRHISSIYGYTHRYPDAGDDVDLTGYRANLILRPFQRTLVCLEPRILRL